MSFRGSRGQHRSAACLRWQPFRGSVPRGRAAASRCASHRLSAGGGAPRRRRPGWSAFRGVPDESFAHPRVSALTAAARSRLDDLSAVMVPARPVGRMPSSPRRVRSSVLFSRPSAPRPMTMPPAASGRGRASSSHGDCPLRQGGLVGTSAPPSLRKASPGFPAKLRSGRRCRGRGGRHQPGVAYRFIL